MVYDRSMTATTYLIDRKSRSVLLHIHKKSGSLYPLGGHIEPHELPHEAAEREVMEESGLEVEIISPNKEKYCYCELPSPFCMLLENTSGSASGQNIDFIYAAFLPDGFDLSSLHPSEGESRRFFLAGADELRAGKLSAEKKCDTAIEPHISGTALRILEAVFGKDRTN